MPSRAARAGARRRSASRRGRCRRARWSPTAPDSGAPRRPEAPAKRARSSDAPRRGRTRSSWEKKPSPTRLTVHSSQPRPTARSPATEGRARPVPRAASLPEAAPGRPAGDLRDARSSQPSPRRAIHPRVASAPSQPGQDCHAHRRSVHAAAAQSLAQDARPDGTRYRRRLCPHPQLERAEWGSLNGPWRFCFDDERALHHPADDRRLARGTIEVPVPAGVGGQRHRRPRLPPRAAGTSATSSCCRDDGRVILHFGAVDYAARVWVNGHARGRRTRAATRRSRPTSPTLLDAVGPADASRCAPRTTRTTSTKPRGKQDWQLEPHSIWYPRTTGIWQTVWLERVGRTYVDKIRWTPHVEGYAIGFEARVGGDPRRRPVARGDAAARRARCWRDDRYQVVDREVDRIIVLSDPGIDDFRNELLWSPERPTLLDATVRLLRAATEVIDEFTSYTALRSVDDPARPLHAQRPALPAAHGARPGLLARHADGRARATRRCAATSSWPRRWASTACASTRRSRTRATSTGPTGSACWSGRRCRAPTASPAPRSSARSREWTRGDRARLQPPVHHRLGAVQRVVGRARADRRCRRSATRSRRSTT